MTNLNLPTTLVAKRGAILDDLEALYAWANAASLDTGWRKIPFANGWKLSAGNPLGRIRRKGDIVTVEIRGLNSADATSDFLCMFSDTDDGASIPLGYAPPPGTRSPVFQLPDNSGTFWLACNSSYGFFVYNKSGLNGNTGSQVLQWTYTVSRSRPAFELPAA